MDASIESLERTTVYLTPDNKARLAGLKRGQKAKKLNEALDAAFEQEERVLAFEDFMEHVRLIKPTKPLVSSLNAVRELRES